MSKPSSEYLHNIYNNLQEAVFVYDQNMEIKYFNPAAEKITGHKKGDVIGRKCVTLFDKSLCLNNCALCMTVKNGADAVQFQSPFIRKDGIKRIGRFQAGILSRDADGQVEVLVALSDITEITHLKEKLKETHSFQNIVGKSHLMKELFDAIRNIAIFDSTVLILGETGTGKELVARAIHFESPRAGKKMITVNCSAFSDNLLESELFGHVKGAFTGSDKDRVGRFEEGDGGTVFLDEVGDLAPKVQIKLLRVLQEKEVQRVGDNCTRKVDIRIIAATHKDLLQEVKEGRFREDLYFRLNVIPVQLPPLRMRKEDIPYLSRHFINHWSGRHQKNITGISDAALGRLMDYHWPGNIRELENAIEHACVKSAQATIEEGDLPASISPSAPHRRIKKRRQKITREMLLQTLAETDHNQTRAAKLLNLHRITLWRKMKTFGIAPTPHQPEPVQAEPVRD